MIDLSIATTKNLYIQMYIELLWFERHSKPWICKSPIHITNPNTISHDPPQFEAKDLMCFFLQLKQYLMFHFPISAFIVFITSKEALNLF